MIDNTDKILGYEQSCMILSLGLEFGLAFVVEYTEQYGGVQNSRDKDGSEHGHISRLDQRGKAAC